MRFAVAWERLALDLNFALRRHETRSWNDYVERGSGAADEPLRRSVAIALSNVHFPLYGQGLGRPPSEQRCPIIGRMPLRSIYRVAELRNIEQRAKGLPLMERAGAAA